MAPQYIHTENANGRTPVEIATSRYLLNICQSPPTPPGGYSRSVHQSVVSAPLSNFYPEEEGGKKQVVMLEDCGDKMELDGQEGADDDVVTEWDLTAVEDMYHFAVTAEKRFPEKRKLVSLADANQLAKRITSSVGQPIAEFDGGDILSLW